MESVVAFASIFKYQSRNGCCMRRSASLHLRHLWSQCDHWSLTVIISAYNEYDDNRDGEASRRSNPVPPKRCMWSHMTQQPMPGALFAIDGTLCRLFHKGKYNEFVSRKSQPQMNMLVLCDWNKNLVYIEWGVTGRTQDNDMFNNCVLHARNKQISHWEKENLFWLMRVLRVTEEWFAQNQKGSS